MVFRQSLIVISNKMDVLYDENTEKYVKIFPGDNIHKRNIKGSQQG